MKEILKIAKIKIKEKKNNIHNLKINMQQKSFTTKYKHNTYSIYNTRVTTFMKIKLMK